MSHVFVISDREELGFWSDLWAGWVELMREFNGWVLLAAVILVAKLGERFFL